MESQTTSSPRAAPDFAAVFDASPSPCLVLAPDATIVAANEAYLKATATVRDQILGRSMFEVFPDNPQDLAANGSANLRASLQRVLRNRSADTMAIQKYDILVPGPDGPAFEERYWNPVNIPLFDATGQLTHILHRAEDVTAFARLEARAARMESDNLDQTIEIGIANRRLRETNDELDRRVAARTGEMEAERRLLQAVLAAAPVGIVVADANGALLQTNPEFRRLWGDSQPLSRSVDEYREWNGWWADGSERHGQRVETADWPIARVLEGQEAVRDIIEIESFDEPRVRRVTLNSAAPIRDEDGRIAGAVVALMDITHQVRAEAALKQAGRRKDEFLAMLAHELRNPLAPIGAAADLLALGRFDEAGIRQTSAIISRQVRHMSALIDDLLDVSRVTRGLATIDEARLDAKRIVADAVEQVRPLIEARLHRLEIHLPPQPAVVLGDQKRLVQVLTNILNNAAKYTPAGGEIILDMRVDGGWVELSIADNGAGMGPELVERAFELFEQGARSSDRSQGGLGIGLALVKSMVELHGGTVRAESEGIGKGSRFRVCLPQLRGESDQAPAEPALARPAARGLKVLVVDDNVDAANMLAMVVEALGHRTLVEHGPHAALARARAERPDACLLDIGLPEMDGNELARRLRADPATAGAVLVAVTGYGQEHEKQQAFDAGFDHHFVKPVDCNVLAGLLGEIAQRLR